MAQSVQDIDNQVDDFMGLGDYYFQCAQSEKAIGSYEMCLGLTTNRNVEMSIYNRLGAVYQSLGKYDKAIECNRKSLSIATENRLWGFEGYACKALACSYYLSGKLNEAVEFYEKCLSIITEIDDKEVLGKVCGELGVVYQSLQNYQQAIECHKNCLCIATEAGNKQIEGTTHANLGIAYTSLGKYREAAEHYQKRLSIAEEMGDREGEGKSYSYLGVVYYSFGKYYKAVECHEKQLSIATMIGDKEEEGNAYSSLGDAYQSLGKYHEAIEYFEKRLSIAKEIGDKKGEANGYGSLGNVYLSLGKINEAMEYQQKILSIVTELGDRHGQGTTYGNIGCAYINLEKYSEAIKYLQKQVNIAVELGERLGEGVGNGNIGNAYIGLGEYHKAIEYCEKSLSIAIEIGDKKREGTAYGRLGRAFGHIGEFRKTIEYHTKHLNIAMETGDREGQGVAHNNIGNVYKVIGDRDEVTSSECLTKSKDHFQKSIQCFEELFDNLQEKDQFKISIFDTFINAYKNLSQVFIRTEQTEKALMTCEGGRARALGDLLSFKYTMNKETTARKYPLKLADILEILSSGDVCILFCDLPLNDLTTHFWVISPQPENVFFFDVEAKPEALETTEPNLSEDDQQEIKNGFFKNLVEKSYTVMKVREGMECEDRSLDVLEYKQAEPPQAISYDQSSETGSNVSQGPVSSQANSYDQSSETGSNVSQGPVSSQANSYDQSSETGSNVTQGPVSSQANSYDQSSETGSNVTQGPVSSQANSYDQSSETVSNVNQGPVSSQANSYDQSSETVSNVTQGPVSSRANSYDQSSETVSNVSQGIARCIYEEEEEEDKPLVKLFQRLITPLKHKLTQNEIVIIPDGPLFTVPFAALQDPETGMFLSETKRIRLAPSLTTLKILQESSGDHHCESGALIVGNPKIDNVKYRGKWIAPLFGAEKEANEIGNLLGVQPLIGKQATKEVILQKLQVGVSVIHFAAHGSVDGQILLSPPESSQESSIPEETDYILTMKEAQESGIRAQLVVLSCCHSGRGEIKSEGVVGMARAFLAAGARAVVASLWAIADDATKVFMLKFYSHLKRGESASKSLQQAMKEMRETEEYKEPRYWAAFFLIGDDVTINVS